jgi:hypothetical protein
MMLTTSLFFMGCGDKDDDTGADTAAAVDTSDSSE